MTPGRYALAGWLAIAQAVLFFPTIALALFFDWISRRFPGSALLAALPDLALYQEVAAGRDGRGQP